MKMAIGKVVDGKIVLEGVSLEEGAVVTVLAAEGTDSALTPEQEAELLLSIEEADRGETVSDVSVIRNIARRHRI
jgi:hypothetical protein